MHASRVARTRRSHGPGENRVLGPLVILPDLHQKIKHLDRLEVKSPSLERNDSSFCQHTPKIHQGKVDEFRQRNFFYNFLF